MKCQVLDLTKIRRPTPSLPPLIKLWTLTLLVALRDGSDNVQLFRRDGKVELWYRVAGVFHPLVPPPESIFEQLLEVVSDLSRPRGLRAWTVCRLRALILLSGPRDWVIRRLKALIRLLGGASGGESSFLLRTGNKSAFVDVSTQENDDVVVLRVRDCDEGIAHEAGAILQEFLAWYQKQREHK